MYKPDTTELTPSQVLHVAGAGAMFGLRGLRRPEQWAELAAAAAAEARAGCEASARAARRGDGLGSLRALDGVSDALCAVIDAAELCRNVHPAARWRAAADATYVGLQDVVHSLNADPALYGVLVEAQRHGVAAGGAEAERVAATLRADFERGGIHLPDDRRAELEAHLRAATRAGVSFGRNLADAAQLGAVDVRPASLPRHLLRGGLRPAPGNTVRVPTDPATLSAVLRWAPDEETRRAAYYAGHTTPKANRGVLRELLGARDAVARALGFDSHADYALDPLLARRPGAVRAFLRAASERARPRAEREAAWLRERGGGGALQAWDVARAFGEARAAECRLDQGAVAEYFPLERVLPGLSQLTSRLFGVDMRPSPLGPDEAWAPSVRKVDLEHRDVGPLGTVYLDLLARPGKFSGAAHFVLRCGRRLDGGEYQLPSVALSCSFAPPSRGAPMTLSHGEVETLLHEFGHVLHQLLSRTEFQHLAGTRCALDLVEVPSHVLEMFAWDPCALRLMSGHVTTGESIPDRLVAELRRANDLFAGYELQQQVLYGLVDLDLHSAGSPETPEEVSDLVASLQNEHLVVPHAPGTFWEARFSHLVGYGAGYYSYTFARCLANAVWERYFAGDPLAPGAGDELRTRLLAHGGARDPALILEDLLGAGAVRESACGGRAPDPSHLLCGVEERAPLTPARRASRASA